MATLLTHTRATVILDTADGTDTTVTVPMGEQVADDAL